MCTPFRFRPVQMTKWTQFTEMNLISRSSNLLLNIVKTGKYHFNGSIIPAFSNLLYHDETVFLQLIFFK